MPSLTAQTQSVNRME